jgi:prolyl oligopeptidase
VASAFHDWLLLELREDWTTNGITYLQGSLLVSSLEAAFAGQASWTVLFEPTSHSALADYCLTKNFIVLNVLENVQNRVLAVQFKGGTWQTQIVHVPTNSTIYVTAFDQLTSDDIWLNVTGFLTPSTLMLGAVDSSQFMVIKSSPSYFETNNLEVTQHWANSKDNTQIPYFLISSKNMVLDGTNPTLLTGYGGFEVPQVPNYSASLGMAWLETGGVYVLANIRGGGEFGPRWHRAALRENRQRAFDDFIAVSEDLISRQVTSSSHLGIRGGSNGGLLMGAMFTQRPDLFAAVVCAVPLLDMQRYHTLLAGASWMAEYGDPDNPEDWAFIKKYSPYQNVFANQTYPPILFTTSTRDDRVHPGHARKMYAKMLEQGHNVLYFENTEGGHAGAANNAQTAQKLALEYSFLWHELTKKH